MAISKRKTAGTRVIMFLLAVIFIIASFISFMPVSAASSGVTFQATDWDAVTKQLEEQIEQRINRLKQHPKYSEEQAKSVVAGWVNKGLSWDEIDKKLDNIMGDIQTEEEKKQEAIENDSTAQALEEQRKEKEQEQNQKILEEVQNDEGAATAFEENGKEGVLEYNEENGISTGLKEQEEINSLEEQIETRVYHYYSTVQPGTTQFERLAGELADANSEGDIKKIMGKKSDDNCKQINFEDLIDYEQESNDNPQTATNLVTVFVNKALSLKGSLGNKQDADWILGDLQNSWSNGNLQSLVDKFEYWFPGFINSVCYEWGKGIVDGITDSSGRNLWGYITPDDLFAMGKGLTMIDLIKGNFEYFDASSYSGVLSSGENGRFQFRSGVTLSDVFDDADDAFKALLVGAVADGYASALQSITNVTENTEELLEQGLNPKIAVYDDDGNITGYKEADFETDPAKAATSVIYDTAKDICKKVMVPVAAVILAFVFAYEIYEMVCERNNMNEIGGGTFVQLIMKLVIAIVLVAYAWEIIELVFNIGSMIVSMASPIAESHDMGSNTMMAKIQQYITDHPDTKLADTQTGVKWIIAVEICLNTAIDFGNTLVLFIQSVIINVGTWVISLIVYIIVYVRLIEIFIDCCVAPIPLATLTNRSWQQTGMNFLRSVFALALQAFIIYLCLAIFNILVSQSLNSILTEANVNGTMWTVIGYSLILIFCLFKSGGLSKSIMAAH